MQMQILILNVFKSEIVIIVSKFALNFQVNF